ncbi:IscS subfamily cysteine desulfurase, partial [Francisella tularensis subsp. holarctica]|nr:IscS subfamily cysteine desulfurase [Francisella tularensis subsp. holarctica]
LAFFDGVCMSMCSACNSHAVEPSHVLSAIGLTSTQAESTLRISFGLQKNKKQVIQAANLLKEKVHLLRDLSPQGEVNV